MKKYILISILLAAQSASAGVWTLNAGPYFLDPKDKIDKSVLQFASRRGASFTYMPSRAPWGFYETKEVLLNGQSHFVTYWVGPARGAYFRIFNPEVSELPICEFSTDEVEPQVRYKNGKVEYLETALQTDSKKVSKWKKCVTPKVEKEPASVPAKKTAKKQSPAQKKK
jgi:hypothetical protein